MSLSAWTAPNVLDTPRSERMGSRLVAASACKVTLSPSEDAGMPGRARCGPGILSPDRLLDAVLRAGRLVRGGADLCGGGGAVELVLDDSRLDRARGHHDRLQQLRLDGPAVLRRDGGGRAAPG